VAKAVASFPGLLTWLWESLYAAALLWVLVLVLAALVTRHRRVLLVEQLGSVVLALGVGGLVAVLEGSSWGQVWSAFATHDSSTFYPAVRFTAVVAVIAVTAPHLARPHRRLGTWVALLGAVGGLALAVDTVLGLVAGLVLGVTVAAVVHLVAGSPGGHVPLERLQAQLDDLGVDLSDLRYVDEPGHLSVVARGCDGDGRPVLVRVYGRDAWEASLLASVWQRLWYRQTAASSIGRQERAEHEAYLTMVAERAGVPVQAALAAGTAWGRDAMLVRRDDGVPLADADSGADAYGRCGVIALEQVGRRDGKLVLYNHVHQALIGRTRPWDQIVVIEFPGTDAFVDMIRDPDYQASLVDRDAGLAEVVILVTQPLLPG